MKKSFLISFLVTLITLVAIVYFMQDKPVLFEDPISQEAYMESLLFIGDSRTNGLGNYEFIKKENIYAVDGLSHIGAQTERFIRINDSKKMTIEEAIAIRQPERVIIGFGINGVGFMDEKTFIKEYEKFLRSLKAKSPSTEFIVQSILPVSSGYERSNPELNNKKIDQYNEQLADLAEQLDMVISGCTVDELFAKLQHMKDYLATYLTVGDLGRLRASGRLSKGAAIVGEIFNIIPILKLVNGNVAVQEKVRGPKSVIKYLMKEMEEKGDRISDQVIPLAYADEQGYALCMMLKKAIEDKYGVKDFFITEVGMSIGSHTGSGAIGCFFLQKEVVE